MNMMYEKSSLSPLFQIKECKGDSSCINARNAYWDKLDKDQWFAVEFGKDIIRGFGGLANALEALNNKDTSKMTPAEKATFEYLMLRKDLALNNLEGTKNINLIDKVEQYNDAINTMNKVGGQFKQDGKDK